MAFGERSMVDVRHLNLKCADCGQEIDELPFEPTSDRPVFCGDCNRKRRPPRSSGGGGGGGGRGGRSGGGRGGSSRGGGGGSRRY
jgi:CxxC-x17-CxxC domain-containing protein